MAHSWVFKHALDESKRRGAYYSNFYGGVIVGAQHYERITRRIEEQKRQLNFFGEVKWSKVSEAYLAKYQTLIDNFFDEVAAGHLWVRIMFRQNAYRSQNFTREQVESEYFRLYTTSS